MGYHQEAPLSYQIWDAVQNMGYDGGVKMERMVKHGIVIYGLILFIVLIRLTLLFYGLNPFSYLPFFLLLVISLSVTARYLQLQKELEGYQMESRLNIDKKMSFKRVP